MATTITVPTISNWKTTLAGMIAAIGAYLVTQPGYYNVAGQVLTVGGLFLMGLVSKDMNTTGGTNVQPSSIEAKEAITTAVTP